MKEKDYAKGISFVQGISQVGFFLSGLMAGILMKWIRVYGTILVAAFTYVPAFLLFKRINISNEQKGTLSSLTFTIKGYRDDLTEGWKYIQRKKEVFYIGITASMVSCTLYIPNLKRR